MPGERGRNPKGASCALWDVWGLLSVYSSLGLEILVAEGLGFLFATCLTDLSDTMQGTCWAKRQGVR